MRQRTSGATDAHGAGQADPGAVAGVPRDDRACERILRAADHYAALGVARWAGEAELQAAKRRLARQVHPDKNSSPLATEAFRRLQVAHDVLADPPSRRRHDARGEAPPSPPAPPRRRPHERGPHEALLSGLVALAVALSCVLLAAVGLLASSGAPRRGAGRRGQGPGSERPRERADPNAIYELARGSANLKCGVRAPSGGLCVVLVQSSLANLFGQPRDRARARHASERAMLAEVQKEVALSLRNSRGQSVPMVWATVAVGGRWGSLLPQGHTLPWPVVLKASRAGLRAAAMRVPPGGGRAKRRLSEGLPRFLQDVASGEAAFVPLRGNVSDLFSEPLFGKGPGGAL